MKSKMKVFVVSLIFSFFVGTLSLFCNPQDEVLKSPHPFYDAEKLSEAVENGKISNKKIDLVLKVLAKYIEDNELKKNMKAKDKWDEELAKDIKKAFTSNNVINPFLEEYLDWLGTALNRYKAEYEKTEGEGYPQDVVTEGEALPPVAKGILSPVMVVDALGSFIAKRFKEELTIKYLEKFKRILENNKDKGWTLLVPTTFTFLENSDPFNYKVFIDTLKESFQNDLNNLDSNLKNFLIKHREKLKAIMKKSEIARTEKEKYVLDTYPKWTTNKNFVNLAILVLDLKQKLKKGDHPADILDLISESDVLGHVDSKFSNPIRLLALISGNLRNKEGDGWIDPKEFKILTKDISKDFPHLFFGLIYARDSEKIKAITFESKSLYDILSADKGKIVIEYLQKALAIAENIQDRLDELKKMNEEENRFEKYYSYLKTVFELIKHGFEIKDFIKDTKWVENIEEAQEYLNDAKKLLEITKNIHDKAYGVALINAVTILKKLLPPGTIKDEIIKYGTFMVSMVEAKDAKEMEKVLAAAALPVGSYRIKRTRPFTISLNSYAGIFGNSESLSGSTEKKNAVANIAFTTPVGIAVSFGSKKHKSSFSFFLSIIDVGAVVRFRLGDEKTKLSEVEWKDVLAPGLFCIYGFKRSPISIGLGVQYGPKLTKVLEDGTSEITPSRVRIGVMLAVDIPIFHFK